jgi:hypothetical protein
MTTQDLKIGSKVYGTFFRSPDSIGIVKLITDTQVIFHYDRIMSVSNSLASGRKLHLTSTTKRISIKNLQDILDGKNKYCSAYIIN